MFVQSQLVRDRLQHLLGPRPLFWRSYNLHLDELPELLHFIAADFQGEAVLFEMVGNAPFADDGDSTVTQVVDEPAKVTA